MSHPPLEKRLAASRRSPARWAARSRKLRGASKKSSSGGGSARPPSPRPSLRALDRARSRSRSSSDCARPASPRVVFKPMSAGEFVRAESDLEQLLDAVARRVGLEDRAQDRLVRLRVADRPRRRPRGSRHDRPTCRLGAVERAASARSCSRAVFRFSGGKNPVYFVYGFKTARSGRSCRWATGRSATTRRSSS